MKNSDKSFSKCKKNCTSHPSYEDEKTVFFIHVMKTAGTSFRKMLYESLDEEVYPSNLELHNNKNHWYLDNHEILAAVNSNTLNLNERRIVCGHYPYILGSQIIKNPIYATFLRNPVERTLSIIGHRKKSNPSFKKTSIKEMLQKKKFVKNQIENYQTKIFGIDQLDDPNVNKTQLNITEKIFSIALDRINSMEFVGITEQFDSSVKLFFLKTGIKLNEIKRENIGIKIIPTDEELAIIEDLVYYDKLLYEEALKQFKQECSEFGI